MPCGGQWNFPADGIIHTHEPCGMGLFESEVVGSFIVGEFFDGIAQHGSWHCGSVLVEEIFFDGAVAVTDFTQHPSDSLVDEIFPIVEKDMSDLECVSKFEVFDECECGHDGDTPFP